MSGVPCHLSRTFLRRIGLTLAPLPARQSQSRWKRAAAAEVKASLSQAAASAQAGHGVLWAHSKHVHAVAVDEAEELYLSLSQRTNEQHVLLVLYSPTCPHCQTIEGEVEKLATGLAHEPSLSICALSADSAAARYFAKEVLGLTATPSYVLFPKGSRTFFKYKGRGRDSSSLLKFLNMVCDV
ncbi:hypothetical protein V8C86DRAFT_837782 [Haematococcus lacustris]